jgi:FAD binding domain-containing protein
VEITAQWPRVHVRRLRKRWIACLRLRTIAAHGFGSAPKMNRILETDLENRTARVQAGATNLGISQAVSPEGFFYAPDPSSQLAWPCRKVLAFTAR